MKTLIFAGTHAQAVQWREQHDIPRDQAEYIHSPERLRGRSTKGVPRVFVGTFWERADALEFDHVLMVCDLHEHRG